MNGLREEKLDFLSGLLYYSTHKQKKEKQKSDKKSELTKRSARQ